jgi:DNA-binding transcriptional LysR family regulator
VLNFQVDSELRSGALVSVLADYCGGVMPVHLVYVRQGLLPLKVRAFLDWMTPRLRQRLKQLSSQLDETTGEWTARETRIGSD